MPLRLHRAVSILLQSGDLGADDAQAACSETAALLVQLDEALAALLLGADAAGDKAGHKAWLRILAAIAELARTKRRQDEPLQ